MGSQFYAVPDSLLYRKVGTCISAQAVIQTKREAVGVFKHRKIFLILQQIGVSFSILLCNPCYLYHVSFRSDACTLTKLHVVIVFTGKEKWRKILHTAKYLQNPFQSLVYVMTIIRKVDKHQSCSLKISIVHISIRHHWALQSCLQL